VNYELYMAEAIAEARRGAEQGERAVGSVAVLDDAMVARDHDRTQGDGDPTAHAVLRTIRAAAQKVGAHRLADMTIFTTLEPCPMCAGALVEAQVRALVFAVPDDRRGSAGTVVQLARNDALPHQISVVSGVREAEARRLDEEATASA